MKSIINKSLAGASIVFILLSLSPLTVYGEDNSTDLDIVKTKVLQLQATDPSLPGGVTEQKGRVGTLLSKLFDGNGKIGNYFLKALGTRNDNTLLKWSGGAGGQFIDSNITDNGTTVGIAIPLGVTGNVSSSRTFSARGSSVPGNFWSNGLSLVDPYGYIGTNGSFRSSWMWNGYRNDSFGWTSLGVNGFTTRAGIEMGNDGILLKSDSLTTGTSPATRLIIQPDGDVGIGTPNPLYKLDVAGDINFTGDLRQNGVVFAGSGGGKFVDGTDTDDAVYTTGNVGIGTLTPSYKLTVNGSMLLDTAPGGDSFILGNRNGAPIGLMSWSDANDILSFGQGDGGFKFNASNGSEIFRILNNGNITAKGTVTAAAPTLSTHLATKGYVDSTAAGAADNLGNHTASQNIELNGQWLSNDGGNEGIRIADNGNVSIGTTNTNGKLEIGGTPGAYGHLVLSDSTNGGILNVQGPSGRAFNMRWNGPSQAYLTASNGALTELFINPQGGNVAIGTTASPTVALQVNGNVIASDPTENSHLATKVYVDNAITVAGAGDINSLTDASTNATNLFLGDGVGDNNTGAGNTAIGQYSFQSNIASTNNTALGRSSLQFNVAGLQNTAIGGYALQDNTANYNTGVGYNALANNTTGVNNTALGRTSLAANTTGAGNVGIGRSALAANITANYNVGVGYFALSDNTTGYGNVGVGYLSLRDNINGYSNSALGYTALANNTTGTANTAVGYQSLNTATGATSNTAIGYRALRLNTTGAYNVALGSYTLEANTTAFQNTAVGAYALRKNTGGVYNTAAGYGALQDNTTGNNNSAFGRTALSNNTTGSYNTAVGSYGLNANTTGNYNQALGYAGLYKNTTGSHNTALGFSGLYKNTTGVANIAVGHSALHNNTTGSHNIGIGYVSLLNSTTGTNNVGLGSYTLEKNTTGYSNTALGFHNLRENTTGVQNTAVGYAALDENTTAANNVALGYYAMSANTTGAQNTALGTVALDSVTDGDYNTGVGYNTLGGVTTGDYNTAIGGVAGDNITTGSSNIIIGYGVDAPSATASNQLNIGNTIYGDLSNGSVGIGTGVGTDKLTVAGDVQINDKIRNSERNDYIQLNPTDDSFRFVANNVERFKVESGGDVGIGIANPTTRLHIVDGNQRIRFLTGTNTSGYNFNIGVNDDGVNLEAESASRGFNFKNNNGTLLSIASGGAATFNSTVTASTVPTAGGHLTNKTYVDTAISAAGGDYVTLTGNQTVAGIKTFSSPIRVQNTFNINGSAPSGQQSGLYVADLGATSGTTNNPVYTAAIAGQLSGTRSIALSVDSNGYLWGYRGHSNAGTYTFQSKTQFADDAGTLDGINSTGFIQVGTSGDQLQDGTIDSSEIQDNTLTAADLAPSSVGTSEVADNSLTANDLATNSVTTNEVLNDSLTAVDLAPNSVGNSELINSPTFTTVIGTAAPTAGTHLTNKTYVDNLVTQGVSWKAPVDISAATTYGSCNAAKEGWATYNKSDNTIYLCNAAAWVNIGTTAAIPYATTSSAGRVQLSGDIGGTWNSLQIQADTIGTSEVVDNSLTADDLAANSVGNSELIDSPTITNLSVTPGVGYGIRFWDSDQYAINMGNTSEFQYGPVTDYSIKTNMASNSGRGWTWGIDGATPVFAVGNTGNAQFAGTVTAATPTAADHLATKSYVDSASSSLWDLVGNDVETVGTRDVDINQQAAIGSAAGNPLENVALVLGETSFAGNNDRTTYQLRNSETIPATTLTGNRTSYGLYSFLNNNKGGTTTSGNRSYATGVYGFTRNTGSNYAYQNIGGSFEGRNESTAGAQNIKGVLGTARQFDGAGSSNVVNMIGGEFIAFGRSGAEAGTTTVTTAKGSYSVAQAYKSDITNAYGVQGYTLTSNTHDGSITNAYGVHGTVNADSDDGGSISSGFGGYFISYGRNTAPLMTNSKGIYAEANDGVTSIGGHFVADDTRATTNYAIYADARNAGTNNFSIYAPYGKAYFADNVGIGTNTPRGKLDVAGKIFQNEGGSYDVWIQGGDASSGDNRNLAFLGTKDTGTDTLYVNYGGEYAGGTVIGGIISGNGSGLTALAGDSITDNTIDSSEIENETIVSADIDNGTLTYSDTNVNSIQRRITATCAAGSSIRVINNDGTVTCETDDLGSGGDDLGSGGTTAGTLYTTNGQIGRNSTNYARWDEGGNTFYRKGGNWIMRMDTAGFHPYLTNTMGLGTSGRRWSSIYAGDANFTTITGNGAAITAIAGDNITDNTIDSSEIQNNTIEAADIITGGVRSDEILNDTITETDISNSFVARNSSLLNGFASTTAATANTITLRDSAADVHARLFRSNYAEQGYAPAATADIAFRINNGADNYIRFMSKAAALSYLGVSANTDNQTLTLTTSTDVLSISGGNTVDFTYLRNGDTITDGTVDSSEIQDNTIAAADIATNGVGAAEIAADAVGTSEVANNSLTAADLAADSVGVSELANNSVGNLNIIDGTIIAADLAANSVGTSEIATNGVGNDEMIDSPTFTNVTATTFTYSDRRLKKNFKPVGNSYDILNLGTYRFDWKADDKSDIGLIAQEVEEIYPEFVRVHEDGYKTVDYAKMVVPLLEVTKKQQAEIDELRAIVEELQTR